MSKHHSHDEYHPEHDDNHVRGNAFVMPFILILAFAAIEYSGGVFTNSLALMCDAGHMLSDALALGLAWLASHHASNFATTKHVSGLSHFELAASIINCLLMLGVTIYILLEALDRLNNPQHVTGFYVMVLAIIGLVVNLIVAKMLHHHGEEHGGKDNLNHRAAFLHVLGDLLASVAALVAGAVIYFTGWFRADPIISLFISALILIGSLNLAKDIWYTLKKG